MKEKPGFTLIELTVSMGIIAVMAAVAAVALNPQKNIQDATDQKDNVEAQALEKAVTQYQIDQGGTWNKNLTDLLLDIESVHPGGESNEPAVICPPDADTVDDPDCVELDEHLPGLVPDFIIGIPQDPNLDPQTEYSGYTIYLDEERRPVVGAVASDGVTEIPDAVTLGIHSPTGTSESPSLSLSLTFSEAVIPSGSAIVEIFDSDGTSVGSPLDAAAFIGGGTTWQAPLPFTLQYDNAYYINISDNAFCNVSSTECYEGIDDTTTWTFGTWGPNEAVGANLKLWFDANDPVTLFEVTADETNPAELGDAVSYWKDKSGQGNHVSQALGTSQPTYTQSASFTGYANKVIQLDGSADFMNKLGATGLNSWTGYTIFTVANRTFAASNRYLFSFITGGVSVLHYLVVPVNSNYTLGTTAGNVQTSTRSWGTGAGDTNFYVRKATWDGTNQRFYYSGANDTDALAGSMSAGARDFYIGRINPGATRYGGNIAEMIFYDGLLSAGEISKVEAYLNAKWGL